MKKLILISLMAISSFLSFSQTQQTPVFVQMPDISKTQAKMLIDGIINYYQQKPDSTSAVVFNRVAEIKAFIDNPNLVTMSFNNIPMKVIDHVEIMKFGGSILNWSAAKDNDSNMIEMQERMLAMQQKQLDEAKLRIQEKKSFQCKYFQLIGLPCPNTN
jgi:predicted metal-dependent TIM-barrel fold hydrolase